MNYHKLLEGILNIGEALVLNGAETYRISDSIERMCKSYGFTKINLFVIPSNLQMTVTAPDGEIITQIRYVERAGIDYDNLDLLNGLCRYVCANTPDLDELQNALDGIIRQPRPKRKYRYIAAVIGCTGYTAFFGCGIGDALISVLVALLIVIGGDFLSRIDENNLMVYNAVLSLGAESLILITSGLGICTHPGSVTLGAVMLLISCLGFINGIREFIERDFLAGSIHVMDSILGAAGIAIGMLLPMFFMDDFANGGVGMADGFIVPAVAVTVACVGFAMVFNVRGKDVAVAGLGACLTWLSYAVFLHFQNSNFTATLFAAIVAAVYAYAASRLCKAPSTIFLTIGMFPLIPGSHMYMMMFNIAIFNTTEAFNEFLILLVTCLGIAFGLNIESVIERNWLKLKDKIREPKGQN